MLGCSDGRTLLEPSELSSSGVRGASAAAQSCSYSAEDMGTTPAALHFSARHAQRMLQ